MRYIGKETLIVIELLISVRELFEKSKSEIV
jgi:hypothetical protein